MIDIDTFRVIILIISWAVLVTGWVVDADKRQFLILNAIYLAILGVSI